jgi:hypothetical protein
MTGDMWATGRWGRLGLGGDQPVIEHPTRFVCAIGFGAHALTERRGAGGSVGIEHPAQSGLERHPVEVGEAQVLSDTEALEAAAPPRLVEADRDD